MTDLRAALTFLFTASFVASPLLTSPFSGFRADQLPIPQVDPPIQPDGYAFAIWGLIYAWLVISAVWGLAVRVEDPGWERVRTPLIVSLAVGTPWLWIANQSAIWATVVIWVMAIFAIAALLRTPGAEVSSRSAVSDRWLLRAPVAIYAGWLTAAACVSLGVTLAGYGVVFGQIGWAYVGIGIALILALSVQNRVAAPEYGLTVIWALVAVVVTNWPASLSSADSADAPPWTLPPCSRPPPTASPPLPSWGSCCWRCRSRARRPRRALPAPEAKDRDGRRPTLTGRAGISGRQNLGLRLFRAALDVFRQPRRLRLGAALERVLVALVAQRDPDRRARHVEIDA